MIRLRDSAVFQIGVLFVAMGAVAGVLIELEVIEADPHVNFGPLLFFGLLVYFGLFLAFLGVVVTLVKKARAKKAGSDQQEPDHL